MTETNMNLTFPSACLSDPFFRYLHHTGLCTGCRPAAHSVNQHGNTAQQDCKDHMAAGSQTRKLLPDTSYAPSHSTPLWSRDVLDFLPLDKCGVGVQQIHPAQLYVIVCVCVLPSAYPGHGHGFVSICVYFGCVYMNVHILMWCVLFCQMCAITHVLSASISAALRTSGQSRRLTPALGLPACVQQFALKCADSQACCVPLKLFTVPTNVPTVKTGLE